jgi:photosystem II stability/assembly factor-like uncharacterized protein
MAGQVLLLIGTRKGAFILDSDAARRSWRVRGPFCDGWPINYMAADPATGAIHAGGGNPWSGVGVWSSADHGRSWARPAGSLSLGGGAEAVRSVWSLGPSRDCLYAGVEPAALFRSGDGGRSWEHVAGLQRHPSRPSWQAGGAGLILHAILPHPADPAQMWVAISAAGVFHTGDGGTTWEARNRGTRADFMPEDQRYPETGQCVHSLAMASGMPDRLYQQNHCGMYRSDDGGRLWHSIEAGLPSDFGFPTASHPRDPDTVYLLPLNGAEAGRYVPDGKAAVWRSRDAGRSWQALRDGLPQENAFFCVLRRAMATDRLDPAGVYFGTNGGALYASADEGDHWTCLAQALPPITSVETLVVDG